MAGRRCWLVEKKMTGCRMAAEVIYVVAPESMPSLRQVVLDRNDARSLAEFYRLRRRP